MADLRRIGMWVLITILPSLNGLAAGQETGPDVLGSVTGKESVWVNNEPALPRRAIFKGDVVQTGKVSSAVMNFQSGTQVILSENSEVALEWVTSPTTLNLRQGAIAVRSSSQQSVRVSVLGASVIVQGEGGFPAICRIAAVGGAAAIFNDGGHVEIHGAGAPLILPKGQFAQLQAGSPQGGAQVAGKVNAAIPAGTVLHKGQTQELPLKIQDAVIWEDLLRTQKTGRVRVELLDGSFLNIGARSEFHVIRHDPQTQQTQVELTLGSLRSEVVKLTKPGANFEVRTPTAVIGVVGTVFLVAATANSTRVHCIEGLLTVRNINPAIVGQVTLRAGQMTSVPKGLPPAGAVASPPGQVQSAMNQTNVGGPGAAGPIAAGAAARAPTAASTVAGAATTATGATSAALSGVAIVRVTDARNLATSANASLATATTSSNEAAAAANSASQAATAVGCSVNVVNSALAPGAVSPFTPPSGRCP